MAVFAESSNKYSSISNKLQELIAEIQDPNFVTFILTTANKSTQFVHNLDKSASLLKDIVKILQENVQISNSDWRTKDVNALAFDICAKMVSHTNSVMLQGYPEKENTEADDCYHDDNSCDIKADFSQEDSSNSAAHKKAHKQKRQRKHNPSNAVSAKKKTKSDASETTNTQADSSFDEQLTLEILVTPTNKTKYTKLRKRRTQSKSKQFDCCLCDKTFTTESAMKSHLIMEHNTKSPKTAQISSKEICYLCGRIMANRTSLKRHLKWHQGDRTFKCTKCDKSFITKAQLDSHSAGHEEVMPYICDTCGVGFRCKYNLAMHSRRHSEDRPHSCDICGKTFKMAGELKAHTLIHTQRKNHTCPECGKKFFTKCKLDRHFLTHTGEKPHQCSSCSKSFITFDMLHRHQRIHTNELPYTCAHCQRKFRDKSNCNKHMKCCKSRPEENQQTDLLEHYIVMENSNMIEEEHANVETNGILCDTLFK